MKTIAIYLFFALLALAPTCSRETSQGSTENKNTKDTERVVPKEYNVILPHKSAKATTPSKGESCCRENVSYQPDPENLDYFGTRHIRVNVHFMYDSNGKNNVPKEIAVKRAQQILRSANHKFRDNCRMSLPQNNTTPRLPIQIQLALTPRPGVPDDIGIYFHDDDDMYYYVKRGKNENRGRQDVIKKYGVQLDTVMNIFIMPHHPDSVKSKKYKADITGLAMRSLGAIKIAGWHINPNAASSEVAKNLNHEVGHMLGLNHSWTRSDGCDDTPPHPNCWHYTKNGSVCDSLISNNLMDYNAGKCALTPCQIGKMHMNLSTEGRKVRNYLEPRFCSFDARNSVIITDSLHWAGAKDMRGDVTIADGGILKISCRVSMPELGQITVMPGAKLILNNNKIHNACGYEWKGIKVYKQKKKTGEVVINGEPIFENTPQINLEAVTLLQED